MLYIYTHKYIKYNISIQSLHITYVLIYKYVCKNYKTLLTLISYETCKNSIIIIFTILIKKFT